MAPNDIPKALKNKMEEITARTKGLMVVRSQLRAYRCCMVKRWKAALEVSLCQFVLARFIYIQAEPAQPTCLRDIEIHIGMQQVGNYNPQWLAGKHLSGCFFPWDICLW